MVVYKTCEFCFAFSRSALIFRIYCLLQAVLAIFVEIPDFLDLLFFWIFWQSTSFLGSSTSEAFVLFSSSEFCGMFPNFELSAFSHLDLMADVFVLIGISSQI